MIPFLVIPAIDLVQGRCARCILGQPGTETLYSDMSDHPVELAQLWRRENAKAIHVTDIDAIKGLDDDLTMQQVVRMQRAVDVPIQFVTVQKDVESYRRLLAAGVYRVAINRVAWTDPDGVRELLDEYSPSRVIFGVRAHNSDVDLGPDVGMVTDEEFIRHVYELGGRRLIYTECDWEGSLTGQNLDTIRRIAGLTNMRITTAGGIASPRDLWAIQELAPLGVDSVVIGRAMYENTFPCQRIWREIEAELEPELHARFDDDVEQSSISRL